MTQPLLHPDLQHAYSAMQTVQARLQQVIRGRDAVIAQVVIALFADGHVLLEDYPGSGKTTLAKALGDALDQGEGVHDAAILPFRRIQFTPDLLPSDITGTTIFDVESRQFAFHRGPLFAHIVLADEINRTSPKVQAAMLEAMAEKQVTVDTVSYPLDELFFVIATQNPMDLNGTYPLPKPQLDRFLFKICMTPIAPAAELEVLAQYQSQLCATLAANLTRHPAAGTPEHSQPGVYRPGDQRESGQLLPQPTARRSHRAGQLHPLPHLDACSPTDARPAARP